MTAAIPVISKPFMPGLTGVRGFSAVWVILYHLYLFSGYFQLDIFNYNLIKYGWAGVDLFFILSGFVLMHVHSDDFLKKITLPSVVKFLKLRVFRIYPVSTAVLGLILLTVLLIPGLAAWYRSVHHAEDFTTIAFFKTLFLAVRWVPPFKGDWNGPVWSLSVEFLGYFLFPFLAFFIIRIRSTFLIICAVLASLVFPTAVFFLRHLEMENNVGTLSLVRVFGFFSCGLVLYRFWEVFPRVSRFLSMSLMPLIVLGSTIAILFNLPWLFPFIFTILIYSIAVNATSTRAIFSNPFAMYIGKLSFPLYLCHVQFLITGAYMATHFKMGAIASAALLAFCLIVAIGLAFLLHTFVEVPAHRWARRSA
jgi:peptidoglycan/LPS O-acetylase OafA/YrhL